MVLDEAEMKQRLKVKESWEQRQEKDGLGSDEVGDDEGIPLWAQEREWGNDGLVTVQSAKWGEFLGTLEGCDRKSLCPFNNDDMVSNTFCLDWEMRGARGLDIELPSLSFGLSPSNSYSWSILDWSRFVHAWRREERLERAVRLENAAKDAAVPTPPAPQRARTPPTQDQRNLNFHNDDVLKASTEKLSTVFDWLIDQIPASAKSATSSVQIHASLKAPEKVTEAANEMMHELTQKVKDRAHREQEEVKAKTTGSEKKNELEAKEDLERFYIALSRKLYDAGL